MHLTPSARALRGAFVAAYEPHVAERLRRLSIESGPDLEGALRSGREWLVDELARLLATPFPDQRRGPLEVFQEAMRFPTEALHRRGAPQVDRDDVAACALPGDVYDLAPASSAELGEAAWRAHLAWGAEKAAAMTTGERG